LTFAGRTPYVATRNYEMDSLCYFMQLSYSYWNATHDPTLFLRSRWIRCVKETIRILTIEQRHGELSNYRYPSLQNNGTGSKVNYTGMSWTGFRPSGRRYYNIS